MEELPSSLWVNVLFAVMWHANNCVTHSCDLCNVTALLIVSVHVIFMWPSLPQDDIIDEVDRLIAAAKCLKERGAYKVYAVATHGIFSENAPEQLESSPLDEVSGGFHILREETEYVHPSKVISPPPHTHTQVLVTNTILHGVPEERCSKIKTIDISLMLAEAIRRIYHGESMSHLFWNIPMED